MRHLWPIPMFVLFAATFSLNDNVHANTFYNRFGNECGKIISDDFTTLQWTPTEIRIWIKTERKTTGAGGQYRYPIRNGKPETHHAWLDQNDVFYGQTYDKLGVSKNGAPVKRGVPNQSWQDYRELGFAFNNKPNQPSIFVEATFSNEFGGGHNHHEDYLIIPWHNPGEGKFLFAKHSPLRPNKYNERIVFMVDNQNKVICTAITQAHQYGWQLASNYHYYHSEWRGYRDISNPSSVFGASGL